MPLSPPPNIDYDKSTNPCVSLRDYTWTSKIKVSKNLLIIFSTCDLETHAHDETKKSLFSTPCTRNFFLCDGVLTKISNKGTIEWMKAKYFLNLWELTEADYNCRAI